MNKKQIVGVVLAVTLAGGAGVLANALTSNDSAAADPAPRSATAAPAPTDASDLVITAGAAGPVEVGMTKSEAAATGLLETDLVDTTDGCPVRPLDWKEPFNDALDVQTFDDGTIASIGVRTAGPKTDHGVGIGSTLAEVLAAYPGSTTVGAGYDQSGVILRQADGTFIGFLFNAPHPEVKDSDTVSFIEVTKGTRPSLMRDGC